jgi:hypothetical protein
VRIGFKVDRIGYYRLFSPLIEAALARGDAVIALHRDHPIDRTGPKAYQWADPDRVPQFRSGTARIVQYRDEGDLVRCSQSEAIEALVTIWAWSEAEGCAALRDAGVTWIALQESHEFHVFPAAMLLRPDRVCLFSEWWVDVVARYYGEVPLSRWREQLAATGWPELDTFRLVDRDDVRHRLGSGGRPIVALASYKQHSDDPWEQLVFRSGGRVSALARVAARGRLDLVPAALSGLTYAAFLRALRSSCDRAGAILVSKSRGKDRPPRDELHLADTALGDEGVYPATVVELAAVARVFVSFLSTVTLEAVFGGGVSLCPMPPEASSWLRSPASRRFRELLGYRRPGTLWNYPGVVEQRGIADLLVDLRRSGITELTADPRARAAYVETFLGGEHGHSARTLAAVDEAVEFKRSRVGRSRADG